MKRKINTLNIKGFTLIELMITVMIVGVLSTFAIPSYKDYVKKARWAEARAVLMSGAMNMEREFSTNNIYTGATIGVTVPAKSESKNYDLSFDKLDDHTFAIMATPIITDAECGSLLINQASEKSSTGTLDSKKCWGIN